VLVHGFGADLNAWMFNQPALAETRRVVAIDLPGHGGSVKEVGAGDAAFFATAASDAIAALAIDRFHLAGHSMGGAIAIEYALRHSGRLAGLALLSAGARLRVAPQILAGVASDFDATVELLVRWMYGEGADPNLLRLGARRLREVKPEALRADFVACDAFDRRADVARIETPTLILCGDADVMTPLKSSEYLRDQIRGSQLVVIPGAGHMAALQHPQAVAAHIGAFLDQL
jgi:pimeloyl-ACP methyl ester carboxylesterase